MATLLLAVGRLRPAFREACDEYLARLRRYDPVDERQIKEAPATASPGEQRRTEGRRLLEKVPARALVIALDREGTAWSSEALARALDGWRQAARPLVLVIGGSTGLDEAVLSRADHRWSFGPLTLPHELARVVALEQWYRAWTILRGERYHKQTGPASARWVMERVRLYPREELAAMIHRSEARVRPQFGSSAGGPAAGDHPRVILFSQIA